jgi:hypothetical protein
MYLALASSDYPLGGAHKRDPGIPILPDRRFRLFPRSSVRLAAF